MSELKDLKCKCSNRFYSVPFILFSNLNERANYCLNTAKCTAYLTEREYVCSLI